ncbi:UV radiation resistance protein/autophagy-related protein 14 family-containing protein [Strongyloides ratti]|uniref:UV radiation resistance protein/autophagy-related protein 14 family-containing protein n=1 Tax=Strongyloides ratti TaxID=34506 RepID=A0A090MWM6_STRRB|nr:UV radiation resistance protein/autophagy-related protein 14 family-containing protein [Strongyloides ratti]CEF63949.1 UV radiation resistance protein/autophagy-related protein 14 family-containing protein [Strongyloides ratti]
MTNVINSVERLANDDSCRKEETVATKISYSKSQWYQLRELARSIKPAQETADELRKQIEMRVKVRRKKFQIEGEIQCIRINIETLEEKIEATKLRIKEMKIKRNKILKEKDKIGNKIKSFKKDISVIDQEYCEMKNAYIFSRTRFTKLRTELFLRRRFMINELLTIYKFDIGVKYNSNSNTKFYNKPCSCGILDFIHGYQHLPTIKCISNHSEQEIVSAINELVHLLVIIGEILGFVYRFELTFHGLYSTVKSTINNEIIRLNDVFSKTNRDKFIIGYGLINKNIAQLRNDVGLVTRSERTLLNLQELLCYLASHDINDVDEKEKCAINDPFNIVAISRSTKKKPK